MLYVKAIAPSAPGTVGEHPPPERLMNRREETGKPLRVRDVEPVVGRDQAKDVIQHLIHCYRLTQTYGPTLVCELMRALHALPRI
jgi:hypothetical protein